MKTWKAKLKRGFALFLALTMCLSMLQLTVLAADESTSNGTANHTHHAEGWICTPYCNIPEHTHTEACYKLAENEDQASIPVTLPDEIAVNDGTSTEKDDFGNEYKPPEIVIHPAGEGEDEVGDSDDDGIAALPEGPEEGEGEDGEPVVQPEGPEEGEGEDGEPVTQPEGPEEGNGESGEPVAQPEGPEEGEGGENSDQHDAPTTQPENETPEIAAMSEENHQPVAHQESGLTTIPETDPPLSGVLELQCGMVEHKHSDACAEREGGGWHCVPDTNITIHVPEDQLVVGTIDLLNGVTATPAYCGNWLVQIAVSAITTADGEELEPEDGRWLTVEEGVVYKVDYVAHLDEVMTVSGDIEPEDMPLGILARADRTLEGEELDGVARIDNNWFDTLQAAVSAAKNGDTIELLSDVKENIVSENVSYTLELDGHVLNSGEVGKNVVTILGGTVTIKNGIITGGKYENTAQDGKGVLTNDADVTLENCVITDNQGYGKKGTTPGYGETYGGYGGGVYAYGGSLTLTGCTVSGNKTSSEGGGVYAHNSIVTINGGTKLVDNTCGGGNVGGAGVAMNGGTLNIDGATISGNLSTNNRRGNAIGLTGANVTATIKNAELSATYESGDASLIYAQYGTGPINMDLEKVDIVNRAQASNLYAIYSAVAGDFTAKDCTFHDSNGSIYLLKPTGMSFTDCQFLNNSAMATSAGAPVYVKTGDASFTNCTFTGNTGYNAGAVYNASTTGTVTMDGCLFTQNSATSYSGAGAIYVATGSKTVVTDTVIKENKTSGTNTQGPAGGISVNGSGTTFTMTSGAVYNNQSEKNTAHDLFVSSTATVSFPAPGTMKDGEVDFSNYAWSNLSNAIVKDELTRWGSWVATNAPEFVATVGETKYKTLDEAFVAAREQSRNTGENVTVDVVEGYIPLSTYYGVTKSTGKYSPTVTLHLNNTHVYGVGITNSFSVESGSTLVLSGTGTLNKNIYMMGGTLNLDGNVVVSGSTLAFNKGPIFDNKTDSKININGNVDKVQIALYKGTVTVSENAHVGMLEALMSTTGSTYETNFTVNGEVDELLLTQTSGKSTAMLNGHIGSLTLKSNVGTATTGLYPVTKAGEKFTVDSLNVYPVLDIGKTYDADGRCSNGKISIYALQDPTQKVADHVLIQGGGGKAANAIWTTSLNNKHTDNKDYKFLTTVVSDENGDLVLRKTVVSDGNYILVDGVNGNDTNDGATLNTPVKTFAKAKELLEKNANVDTIHVLGTIAVTGEETWELGENQTLESFPTFNGALARVPSGATLNLKNITVDGKGINRESPLIENKGTLNIEAGAKLTGGVNTVIYAPNSGSGIDGGAVYNSGTLNMNGGEISGNTARTGAGVFNKGNFTLNNGTISGNTGYGGRFSYSYGGSLKVNSAPAGGGVFLSGSNGTMTMNGGTISNNTSSVGGGIALGNETNAYISYGGAKLTMNGGVINGNSAGQGGGIFIQEMCEATITGGEITNNHATRSSSVATGISFLYGGGGIYVNGGTGMTKKDGKLYLTTAAITGNTANNDGGGIAGCPSANIDVKLDDGGVVAGNTVGGKPYDVYINRGIVAGPSGSGHTGGVRFTLAKYMMGGALYHWTHWNNGEPGERVFFQDITYSTTKTGGFYSDADPAVFNEVAKKCAVTISGNDAVNSGGGIGTNGEVHIGHDPDLYDFFDVTVQKNWTNQDGETLSPDEIAELEKEVQSVTVELYRRVVNDAQGPEDNWELVDSRYILPGEDGFWEMNRPFDRLLKVLDGQPLEYRVVELASMTDAWTGADGGVIKLVTPPIRETDANSTITAEGTVVQPYFAGTVTLDWQMNNSTLTAAQMADITSISIILKDGTGKSWTVTKEFDSKEEPSEQEPSEQEPSEETPDEENGSAVALAAEDDAEEAPSPEESVDVKEPEITINGKESVTIKYLSNETKYTMEASCEGKYGLKGQASAVAIAAGSSNSDASFGTLNNRLNAPSLILVKEIDGQSLAGKTFEFTIEIEGMEPIHKTLTIPADGTSDSVTLAWADELKGVKAGTEFTVTEKSGQWNPTWTVENALGTDGKSGLVASGTLCYGTNTVTFKNYEPSKLAIPVKKQITGDTPKTIPTFQFTLSYVSGGDSDGFEMPAATTLTLDSNAFGDGKEASGMFEAIKFSKAGLYTFKVTEASSQQEGWTFDTAEWTVTVSVTEENGVLTAKLFKLEANTGATNDSTTVFTNTYRETRGSLTIVKEVSGGGDAAQNKAYTFTVTGPNGYSNKVTVSSATGWKTTLTELLPGDYTVTEDDASISGYTWTATGSGVVTATVEAKETAEVTITNTYAPPPPPTTPDPDPDPDPGPGPGPGPNPPPTPETPIDPNPTPLTELPDPNDPESPEEVTVIEEDVPKTYIKVWDPEEEEFVYVPEDEVPLGSAVPETGDNFSAGFWSVLCLSSAAGLAVLSLSKPKKEEEMN